MDAWTMLVAAGAGAGWLIVLTAGLLALAGRVRRLARGQRALETTLAAIRRDLGGLRADLRDVARGRQLEDLRRLLLADLRPLIADTVDLRLAGRPAATRVGGLDIHGAATVGGPAVGGDVGTLRAAPGAPAPEDAR